jgi:hypothetical protein
LFIDSIYHREHRHTHTESDGCFTDTGDEPNDIFANERKGSDGEYEELEGRFEGTTSSGTTTDIDTGLFDGICVNVADVGEKAAASDPG